MQRPKLVDNATAGLKFQDSSTAAALDGTIVRSIFQNDNFDNLFNLVINAGYDLIDDDLSQIVKAIRGEYNATFTYNTSTIATQSVNDIVLGSDGIYYEVQDDGVSGDDPVGSVTGDWKVADLNFVTRVRKPVTITPDADSDYTLTTDENTYGRLTLVDGSWTASRNIIIDDNAGIRIIDNSSGTYTATVKTSGGTGIPVLPGVTVELYNDGTNVIILSQEIGVNQTWQDLTGSRAESVTYTNTTGKPIFIHLSIESGAGQDIYIDGVIMIKSVDATAGNTADMFAIIPNGSTYRWESTTAPTLFIWSELR